MLKHFGNLIFLIARLTLRKPTRSLQEKLRFLTAEYKKDAKAKIPRVLIDAVILAEDRRFYAHGGVDLYAIARAFRNAVVKRRLSGASTLEQQLVRTVTRDHERSLQRKCREILLASVVHTVVPKSDVPGLYLSVAYFGWQMNGVLQAYRRLGIESRSMTQWQSAALVARLKYPEPAEPSPQRKALIETRTRHLLALLVRLKTTRNVAEGIDVNAADFDF